MIVLHRFRTTLHSAFKFLLEEARHKIKTDKNTNWLHNKTKPYWIFLLDCLALLLGVSVLPSDLRTTKIPRRMTTNVA
jgi:hypothetical protein